MDASILLILVQDGVVNGAIYALLALSLVLVFTVTRIVFIPQGELVAYGALTYATLNAGHVPGSVFLLCGLGMMAGVQAVATGWRTISGAQVLRIVLGTMLLPAAALAATVWEASRRDGALAAALVSLLVVAPMAPYLYRIAFQPLAERSVLVLLIAAVGVHLSLVGLGLVFFGPEGFRGDAFSDGVATIGALIIPAQAIWIFGTTAVLMILLALFFSLTLRGKALRATAVNRLGARLVGISAAQSGQVAFGLAGLIGALSGVLIVPLTTIYYDSGFVIGLKGFVAAIVGGLASYPWAVLAALLVGIGESVSSFYASAFKEVIVFGAIIPVLLIRSLAGVAVTEDET